MSLKVWNFQMPVKSFPLCAAQGKWVRGSGEMKATVHFSGSPSTERVTGNLCPGQGLFCSSVQPYLIKLCSWQPSWLRRACWNRARRPICGTLMFIWHSYVCWFRGVTNFTIHMNSKTKNQPFGALPISKIWWRQAEIVFIWIAKFWKYIHMNGNPKNGILPQTRKLFMQPSQRSFADSLFSLQKKRFALWMVVLPSCQTLGYPNLQRSDPPTFSL
jgi:hypothetical protein